MTVEEFAEIDDSLTVSDEDSQEGLININTAPEDRAGLHPPESGRITFAAVVSYRQSNADNLTSVAWLAEALEEDERHNRPDRTSPRKAINSPPISPPLERTETVFCRVQFVIDTSEGDPVIRYRKDLTRLWVGIGTVKFGANSRI